jgi:diacylglycerol kinase (ATP)
MRAAAILGLGCSPKDLKPFQTDKPIEWRMGLPASSAEVDVILLFGGDGTIHRHLGQLVRLGLPVLVVPAGSGNDFARSLGLKRVRDSLAAWSDFCGGSENVRTIDLGVVTPLGEGIHNSRQGTRYFCCVAGVGLDSEVARSANQLPRWLRGHGGYALTLIPKIFRFSPLRMRIQRDTEIEHRGAAGDSTSWTSRGYQPTILAAFANTPIYGGGMKIAPRAKMDDGLLDVCVVGGVDPFKLFCMFPTVYYGGHLKIREVEYFSAPRVRVETEQPVDVYADGESVGRTPVEVAVQRGALRVIVHPSQTSF